MHSAVVDFLYYYFAVFPKILEYLNVGLGREIGSTSKQQYKAGNISRISWFRVVWVFLLEKEKDFKHLCLIQKALYI